MTEQGPHGPKVLLVDDDAGNLAMLRERLESEGVEVVGEAMDGATGVELAKILCPDVVLMDVRMPGMDGFEATRQIREAKLPLEVIMLTFYEELLTEPAQSVGAFAYLVKGCSLELMRDVIFQAWRRAVEARRARERGAV